MNTSQYALCATFKVTKYDIDYVSCHIFTKSLDSVQLVLLDACQLFCCCHINFQCHDLFV